MGRDQLLFFLKGVHCFSQGYQATYDIYFGVSQNLAALSYPLIMQSKRTTRFLFKICYFARGVKAYGQRVWGARVGAWTTLQDSVVLQ